MRRSVRSRSRRSAAARCIALVLVLATGGCGHSRPTAAERVLVPLVPRHLPGGYVLSVVGERPTSGGGRWIDLSFAPAANAPTDATDVVSLHQFLDIDPDLSFLADGGEQVEIRGRRGVCGEDGILRWLERRTALLSVGGGGLPCAELRLVAVSLTEVGAEEWRRYESSARDG